MKYVLVLLCFVGVAVTEEDIGLSICPGNDFTHFTFNIHLEELDNKIYRKFLD